MNGSFTVDHVVSVLKAMGSCKEATHVEEDCFENSTDRRKRRRALTSKISKPNECRRKHGETTKVAKSSVDEESIAGSAASHYDPVCSQERVCDSRELDRVVTKVTDHNGLGYNMNAENVGSNYVWGAIEGIRSQNIPQDEERTPPYEDIFLEKSLFKANMSTGGPLCEFESGNCLKERWNSLVIEDVGMAERSPGGIDLDFDEMSIDPDDVPEAVSHNPLVHNNLPPNAHNTLKHEKPLSHKNPLSLAILLPPGNPPSLEKPSLNVEDSCVPLLSKE